MKIEELLHSLTLEEKLMQITQLLGDYYISEDYGLFMGLTYGREIDEFMAWNTGSLLGIDGAKNLINAQNEYLKRSNKKIPLLFMNDIIHGYRTIFPSPLAMACSWQPQLLERSAAIAAKEASVAGLHLTFSPMADLSRDARWGRVVEGTGEDVYLNGLYAAALVRGYQGDDIKKPFKIASCLKHFAGYGMAEAGRDYNTTEISEYALREHHFPAYKAALDAGAKMVMTSFNALNGVPSTGNRWLYKAILRGEMGFDGVVISDCTAIPEMICHGYAANDAEAAEKALKAGVDIEMVSTTYYDNVKKLLDEGKLSMAMIDDAVFRVLKLKDELGLFENPYKDANEELEKKYLLCDEHRQAAREIAVNSMVLLKNNGVLPLKDKKVKIALIGPYADSKNLLDIWSAKGRAEECVTLFEGLKERLNVSTAKGVDIEEHDKQEWKDAIELAKSSDIILLAIGEGNRMCAEAGSRAFINLPGQQEEFAEEIFALGKPVVVILFNGRPLAIENISKKADAILEAWLPGTEGGNAAADILTGEVGPTGRLTMSFPYSVGQCPIYYNAYPTGRPKQSEEDPERFRSRYLDSPNEPLYPFGYGLTYSEFAYSPITLSQSKMTEDGQIKASVTIANTGKYTATETVQLYIRDVSGSLVRPVKMLKGFERVTLNPGEKQDVEFVIDSRMLSFHTLEEGFKAEKGIFHVYIAGNALSREYVEFELI